MPLTGAVDIPPRDREVLEGWTRARAIRADLVQRAHIVLLAGDGSVRTDGDPARVGAAALTAGIALTELRSAEGAGLEDMFLSLTADTRREGVAA